MMDAPDQTVGFTYSEPHMGPVFRFPQATWRADIAVLSKKIGIEIGDFVYWKWFSDQKVEVYVNDRLRWSGKPSAIGFTKVPAQ